MPRTEQSYDIAPEPLPTTDYWKGTKMKTRVLFVCIHNSARSQMAEAFANAAGDGQVEAESAGITPSSLNQTLYKS